jgi:hypothetical protein
MGLVCNYSVGAVFWVELGEILANFKCFWLFRFLGTVFENAIENYGVSFPSQINPPLVTASLPERLYHFSPYLSGFP